MVLIRAALLVALLASVAEANEPGPIPEHRLHYRNFTVLRINPLGLQNQFAISYQYRLYDSDSRLFRTGFFRAGLEPIITPGLARLGVAVEIEPIAVLRLGAKWEFLQYYGTFDHMNSYPDTDSDYSDTAIEHGGEAGTNYAGSGINTTLHAELRAKVWNIVVRSKLLAIHNVMDLTPGHKTWYDPYYDVLQRNHGWALINDADLLLFLLDDKLIVGVRHNVSYAMHPGDAVPATQRVGPLVAYRFFDDPGAAWNRPTAVLLANWYLKHPYRTGQDVDPAIPYVAIGLAMFGDVY